MPSGGPGRNAGNKQGTRPRITVLPSARQAMTAQLVERVKELKITPLEVMLADMKFRYTESRLALAQHEGMEDGDPKLDLMKFAKIESTAAADSAAKCAPYIHAKLQTTTLKGDQNSPLEVALGLFDAATLYAAVRGAECPPK